MGEAGEVAVGGTERARLTARYLDEVVRHGARAGELLAAVAESELLDALYHGKFLSRPLFAGRGEIDRCHSDLENVHTALVSLPDRLYGGDLAAFARAAGMEDVKVSAILRSRSAPVCRYARADLYADESGFRLLEYNMGSMIAGLDNADICRAQLRHPLLARFAGEHKLGYVDSRREQIASLLAETGTDETGTDETGTDETGTDETGTDETGTERGSFPVVAVVVWPGAEARLGRYLRLLAELWRDFGLDACACHIGELDRRGGRIWLRGKAVDIIYRLFLLEHLLESEQAPALMEPVLDAVAGGEVRMFTPLDSELFGTKGALAMLSDDANRHLFSAAELASIDRILPWTRMVRPGPARLEDGSAVDLLDYAAGHQEHLVLKPADRCGGEGVVLGWQPGTSPAAWRTALARAAAGSYVIQRRVRPVPELFPGDDGGLVPWIITWGVLTGVNGYAGTYARGLPAGSGAAVTNLGRGAAVGSCLTTETGPG